MELYQETLEKQWGDYAELGNAVFRSGVPKGSLGTRCFDGARSCDVVLTSQELAQVCRIFMDLAYPDGIDSMPAGKRPYYQVDADRPLEDYLPPTKLAVGVCQDLAQKSGDRRGYAFRLGSATYPHLKLLVQFMAFHDREVRVYSVDTHDGFIHGKQHSPEEAEIWRAILADNRALKHDIEEALALAGYLTPKHLLQLDLAEPVKPA